ncbi:MAG: hypothetical protein Q9166_005614 [cf. Caloplaca sp. 2 TL-2023]
MENRKFCHSLGPLMQNAAFAVVIPIYLAIHLSTSPTVSSRKRSDFFADPTQFITVPYAVAIGLVLPTILLALPAPSIISHERKQLFMAIWQAFPLWTGMLQTVMSLLRQSVMDHAANDMAKKDTVGSMRTVYAFMLIVAVVTRLSTWTILDLSVILPSIFDPKIVHLLNPSAVLRPASVAPSVKMPSIAAGSLQFLQYDEMIGAFAMVVWSSALYISAMERKGLAGWAALLVKGVLIEALAGPQGFAVAVVWARDEHIFAGASTEKKNL